MSHGNVGSQVERKERGDSAKFTVDRESTCPLLLRVFCSTSRHNSMSDYMKGNTPTNELQMYTWMDATLKELEGLVKEVNPEARRRGTYFDFALVYPDLRQNPRCQTRDVGTTISGQKGPDDTKTLQNCKFVIGDYIDIAVTPPTGRMDRMDYGRRGFGGDRRNGFGAAGGGGGGGFRGGRGRDRSRSRDRMDRDRMDRDRMDRDRMDRDRTDRERGRF